MRTKYYPKQAVAGGVRWRSGNSDGWEILAWCLNSVNTPLLCDREDKVFGTPQP